MLAVLLLLAVGVGALTVALWLELLEGIGVIK